MTSAPSPSPQCRSQGVPQLRDDRRAALRRANSRGAIYPRLLCGRSSLYSSFHAPIFTRAANKFPNQLAFKHSSRNFPWKLSTYPFCLGRPGSMCTSSIFRSSAHRHPLLRRRLLPLRRRARLHQYLPAKLQIHRQRTRPGNQQRRLRRPLLFFSLRPLPLCGLVVSSESCALRESHEPADLESLRNGQR